MAVLLSSADPDVWTCVAVTPVIWFEVEVSVVVNKCTGNTSC